MSSSDSCEGQIYQNQVRWWHRVFALDLRALAAARIMAGLVLLVDLGIRLGSARAFLCEEGVYPRQMILDAYAGLALPSLHIANDTLAYQVGMLILHMLFSLALLIGFRTTQTTVVCWLLLVSLHLRNGLILNSGDVLLSCLLFWAMFLPWGKRWSWDARTSPTDDRPLNLHYSAASVGLVIQMSSVYLFAALHKMHHPYWMNDGTAVLYALSIEPHATEWALALTAYPQYLKGLSSFVVYAELLASLALLAPWPRLRLLTLAMCLAMHWFFGAFLEIGIFRWSPWVGLLAMMPPLLFSRAEPQSLDDRLDPSPRSFVLLALCSLTWAVNLQSLGQGQITLLPPVLERLVPSLGSSQYWGVFTGDGLKEDSWHAIEVQTRSGKSYDAWLDSPFSKEKPRLLLSATYPDDRWRKWMMNLPVLVQFPGRGEAFARWWLDEWDRRHPEDLAQQVTVWQVYEPTLIRGASPSLYWQRLAEASR